MTRIFRQFTGIGATFALLGALVATGCGQAPRGIAPGVRADHLNAKGAPYAVRFQARPQVRNLRAPLAGIAARGRACAPSRPSSSTRCTRSCRPSAARTSR